MLAANPGGRHDFWAGDGDDHITIGGRWGTGYGFGGRGDDTFILPDVFETANYDGGLGSDTFTAIAESEAPDNLTEGNMTLKGG